MSESSDESLKNHRFLPLLSSFDWTFSPMVIDINNDFTLKDEKEINVSSLSPLPPSHFFS